MLDKRLDLRSGLDPKDYRYINPNPAPDFSPERNQALIDETIRESDKFHNDYRLALGDSWEERKNILAHYAKYTIGQGHQKSIKDYIGKKAYETLIGERILSKVRVADSINRLNGNTRFKKGILL